MKRLILNVLAFAIAAALAIEASAGSNTTSQIALVGTVPSANTGYFQMVGPINTPASCASLGYFAVNISTEGGKSAFKILLAAQVQNLPLMVYGTGQCTQSGGSEDVLYIWYNPPTN